MMEGQGKNCIGIRCANESSCETVPQMYGEYEDLQIAHVSGRGLKNIEIGKFFFIVIALVGILSFTPSLDGVPSQSEF